MKGDKEEGEIITIHSHPASPDKGEENMKMYSIGPM